MSGLVIVGGGIGGLATALAAAERGRDVVVLERNERFAELGAGIQLSPNGIDALDALGLGNSVRESAVHMDELRFMDGVSGHHVASMPLTGDYRRRFRNPYVVVHRGELYGLLLDACRRSPRISLRAGCRVTGYAHDADSASAVLEDGTRIPGAAVIGADGIHSAVRHQLVDDGPPRISGITVYRLLVPIERVPEDLRWNSVTWWAGPKCHLVHYPVAGGRSLNLAASSDNGATEATAGVPVDPEHVQHEFAALGTTPRRLLELGDDWKSWVLIDREPVAAWTDGRVALLGDAAHPMLHYAAQGACMALEDAILLGASLDCSDATIPRRLAEYNAARRDRTALVQRTAIESIRLWHPTGSEAESRNAALSAMSSTDLHDHVAWMHGFRVSDPPVLTSPEHSAAASVVPRAPEGP